MIALAVHGAVGRYLISACEYWLNLVAFAQIAVVDWFKEGGISNRANRQSLVTQIIFTGIGALPIISLLAIITAVGLTSQVLNISDELGREIDVYGRIAHLICYELAPLMTALVVISRSGSAIAVDIGNMKLRGEIDGLTLLGIDIDDYIVAPRILAGALCQLMLSVYFALIALYGGILAAGLFFSGSYFLVLDDVLYSLPLQTILLFIFKNILFGAVITSTASFHALQVGSNTTELPQQTQKAIVRALAQVFLLNVVFMVVAL